MFNFGSYNHASPVSCSIVFISAMKIASEIMLLRGAEKNSKLLKSMQTTSKRVGSVPCSLAAKIVQLKKYPSRHHFKLHRLV